jgi:bifunctional UDP-N-acetylglucosamine pyrophosphorylase / glucosamine-1-phosphate N-acetyltransferase
MTGTPCLFVILAAGEGSRMRSAIPKVMHPLAGEAMLGHVLASAARTQDDAAVAVVVGPGMEQVSEFARHRAPGAEVFVQHERLGTANAVLAARDAFKTNRGDVIVLYGDTPLIRPETLAKMREALTTGGDMAVLGFMAQDPAGYGRLIREGNDLKAIREDADASAEERAIRLCNSGVMAFRAGLLPELLDGIGNTNAKGEYYLTDAVGIAVARGLNVRVVEAPEDEVLGVNSRAGLAEAEASLQRRLRNAVMDGGATLMAPETVFLSRDTQIGRDVVIEPNVFFGPGVTVHDGATIRAFSHLEGATVGASATVGPFARLRPGTELGDHVRIGNFVEVKAARIESGAKANHLAYIGDARVGAGANVGAGTIICNYDGTAKHHTDIGAGAFIGSNSALVAPVRIGDGAYVGTGTVVTKDVAPGALAVGRARQVEKPGWVANLKRKAEGGSEDAG